MALEPPAIFLVNQTRGMVHEMGKGPAHFLILKQNQTRGMVHKLGKGPAQFCNTIIPDQRNGKRNG